MRTIDTIQEQLKLLYTLQKEQEFQLKEGVSKLSAVLTPVNVVSQLIGTALKSQTLEPTAHTSAYSPLWDKVTDQIGITSPLAKSTIHLLLEQVMNKWQPPVISEPEANNEKTSQNLVMDHSLNHL